MIHGLNWYNWHQCHFKGS